MVLIKSKTNFLRKHRKWPYSPYKAKWQQTFAEHQAMEAVKEAATNSAASLHHHQENPNKPFLLSTLIHSFSLYNCQPTPDAYHFILKTLAKTSQSHHIPPVLDRIESVEKFETPEYIFVDLIQHFGDANRIQDAIDLFCRIPQFRCVPSVYSLNCLLSVLCRHKEGLRMVPDILWKSQIMKIRMEESGFCILISTLCRLKKVGHAIEILKYMIDDGYTVDLKMCSLILSSLCEQKGLSSMEILGFLEELRKVGFSPGSVDYTNVIRVLVNEGRGMDSFAVLNRMKVDGIKPDIVCYTMVLGGVIGEENYAKADELFDELLVLGLSPDICTYNVYIKGLCRQNNVDGGIKMVACMEELGCKPNIVTYNTLIYALSKLGEVGRVRELVKKMVLNGVGFNLRTYGIMLDSLVRKGELIEACRVLGEMLDKCFQPQCSIIDEIICGLCQRGLVSEVLELVRKMLGKSIAPGAQAWEALLRSSVSERSDALTTLISLVKTVQVQTHPVQFPKQL